MLSKIYTDTLELRDKKTKMKVSPFIKKLIRIKGYLKSSKMIEREKRLTQMNNIKKNCSDKS